MRRRGERGFTLLELVASIAVSSVLGLGLVALLAIAARSQVMAVNLGDALDAGSLAAQHITMELREMQSPMSVGLLGMSTSELHFALYSGTTVRYQLSSGTLTRSENGGTAQKVASGVTAFTVTYREADGTVATTAREVRRVEYRVEVTRDDVVRTFGGQVFPRGLDPYAGNWREGQDE